MKDALSCLRGASFVSLSDFDAKTLKALIAESIEEKHKTPSQRFKGKSLALLFEKPSTRTRSAFATAFGEEGGHVSFLSTQDLHLGAKESIEDTARILGSMFDLIAYRGFAHENITVLASHAGVPVINALTDASHPTEALADMMTLWEIQGDLKDKAFLYCGDAQNNVASSLLIAACMLQCHIYFFCPKDYGVLPGLLEAVPESQHYVHQVSDLEKVPASLIAVYTDVWISMGQEAESAQRETLFAPYQVNNAVMERFPQAVFLHCLPAKREKEVTTEVIDGPRSHVWDQARNRKFVLKTLMCSCLGLL